MNIGIIGAEKNTSKVRDTILNNLDNVKVEIFESIDTYVQIVTSRNWKIDRIIIIQNALPTADTKNYLMRFQKFCLSANPKLETIFIVKDLDVAVHLSDIYVSQFDCIYYTIKLTPPQLVQMGSEGIETLKEKYGYKRLDDTIDKTELDIIENKKPEKKKGLLTSIFGKKAKQASNKKKPEGAHADELDIINPLGSMESLTDEDLSKVITPVFTDTPEDISFDRELKENMDNANKFYNNVVEDQEENTDFASVKNDFNDFEEFVNEFENTSYEQTTVDNTYYEEHEKPKSVERDTVEPPIAKTPIEDPFSVDTYGAINYPKEEVIEKEEVYEPPLPTHTEEEELYIPDIEDKHETSTTLNTVNEEAYIPVNIMEEDKVEQDTSGVLNKLSGLQEQADFIGNIQTEQDDEDLIKPLSLTPTTHDNYESIETIGFVEMDVNIQNLETAYREQVMPNQGTSAIDDSGKVMRTKVSGFGGRRNIIVTGDRGSGITSTALAIASMLNRKEPTLYVDFDIERKGFIYYCGIENIIEADDYIQSGLTYLNRFDNIKSHVYRYHKGQFDTLISFLDTSIDDDDITRVQKILTMQKDYRNVVIDCPIDKLWLLREMTEQATVLICTRVKIKPLITVLGHLSNATQDSSHTYNLYKNARFVITDGNHPEDLVKSLLYVRDLFSMDEEEIDWTDIPFVGSTQNMMALLGNVVDN